MSYSLLRLLKHFGVKENPSFKERQSYYKEGVSFNIVGEVLTYLAVAIFIGSFIFFIIKIPQKPQFPYGIIISIIFFIIGSIIRIIGDAMCTISKKGEAAAGLILDPQKEREDKKEQNKGFGGQISDMIEEIPIVKNLIVIKIKCRECGNLNDELNKFCGTCGKEIL
jgi:hypothetical protein